jgi:2-polyprenyl-3-methyl-5-hydroxy-6-metoxy-1,4-benzoquinol methylase
MNSTCSAAAVQLVPRPTGYYAQARPEIAALVPPEAHRVLDVGCGDGELGKLLVERGHHVTGLELASDRAAVARAWLDEVVVGDVGTDGFPFPPRSFDAIVFADVLEHLLDPWRVLREAAPLLSANGRIVASVPNLQNYQTLVKLARGKWRYRDHGLTDFGHVRFFTLETVRELFAQAGFVLKYVGFHYRRTWMRRAIRWLTAGRAEPLLARQLHVVALRAS